MAHLGISSCVHPTNDQGEVRCVDLRGRWVAALHYRLVTITSIDGKHSVTLDFGFEQENHPVWLAFNRDGTILVIITQDEVLSVQFEELAKFIPEAAHSTTWNYKSPEFSLIHTEINLNLQRCTTRHFIPDLLVGRPLWRCSFKNDGQLVLMLSRAVVFCTISSAGLTTINTLCPEIPGGERFTDVALSPTDPDVFATTTSNGLVVIWRQGPGNSITCTANLAINTWIHCCIFNPNGNELLIGANDNRLLCFDFYNRTLKFEFRCAAPTVASCYPLNSTEVIALSYNSEEKQFTVQTISFKTSVPLLVQTSSIGASFSRACYFSLDYTIVIGDKQGRLWFLVDKRKSMSTMLLCVRRQFPNVSGPLRDVAEHICDFL